MPPGTRHNDRHATYQRHRDRHRGRGPRHRHRLPDLLARDAGGQPVSLGERRSVSQLVAERRAARQALDRPLRRDRSERDSRVGGHRAEHRRTHGRQPVGRSVAIDAHLPAARHGRYSARRRRNVAREDQQPLCPARHRRARGRHGDPLRRADRRLRRAGHGRLRRAGGRRGHHPGVAAGAAGGPDREPGSACRPPGARCAADARLRPHPSRPGLRAHGPPAGGLGRRWCASLSTRRSTSTWAR